MTGYVIDEELGEESETLERTLSFGLLYSASVFSLIDSSQLYHLPPLPLPFFKIYLSFSSKT